MNEVFFDPEVDADAGALGRNPRSLVSLSLAHTEDSVTVLVLNILLSPRAVLFLLMRLSALLRHDFSSSV